jgi:hypothetical protein
MLQPTGPFAVGARDFTWRAAGAGPLDTSNSVTGRLFYPAPPGVKGTARATWIKVSPIPGRH